MTVTDNRRPPLSLVNPLALFEPDTLTGNELLAARALAPVTPFPASHVAVVVDLPVERPPWMRQGACLGVDPDLFFPERGDDCHIEAKRICAGCPVRVECLEFGLTEKHGIWGGLSDGERRRERRRRAQRGAK